MLAAHNSVIHSLLRLVFPWKKLTTVSHRQVFISYEPSSASRFKSTAKAVLYPIQASIGLLPSLLWDLGGGLLLLEDRQGQHPLRQHCHHRNYLLKQTRHLQDALRYTLVVASIADFMVPFTIPN